MIELSDVKTKDGMRLCEIVNWDVKPKVTEIEEYDEDGLEIIAKHRVTKVMRKDGLWQVVPMDHDQVMVAYAFATFSRAEA